MDGILSLFMTCKLEWKLKSLNTEIPTPPRHGQLSKRLSVTVFH